MTLRTQKFWVFLTSVTRVDIKLDSQHGSFCRIALLQISWRMWQWKNLQKSASIWRSYDLRFTFSAHRVYSTPETWHQKIIRAIILRTKRGTGYWKSVFWGQNTSTAILNCFVSFRQARLPAVTTGYMALRSFRVKFHCRLWSSTWRLIICSRLFVCLSVCRACGHWPMRQNHLRQPHVTWRKYTQRPY